MSTCTRGLPSWHPVPREAWASLPERLCTGELGPQQPTTLAKIQMREQGPLGLCSPIEL